MSQIITEGCVGSVLWSDRAAILDESFRMVVDLTVSTNQGVWGSPLFPTITEPSDGTDADWKSARRLQIRLLRTIASSLEDELVAPDRPEPGILSARSVAPFGAPPGEDSK